MKKFDLRSEEVVAVIRSWAEKNFGECPLDEWYGFNHNCFSDLEDEIFNLSNRKEDE